MKNRLFYWSGPHVNVQEGNYIYDRFVKDGYDIKPYYDYILGNGTDLKKRMKRYRQNLFSIFFASRQDDVIFVNDSSRAWLLALFFSVFCMKRDVVINNYMYDGAGILKKILLKLAFNNMRVSVNSPAIKNILQSDLGGVEDKIFVIPDCAELFGEDFEEKWKNSPRSTNPPYVFMGGNTRRDFDMVLRIADSHPEWNFVIVAPVIEKERFKNKSLRNVKVFFSVTTQEFVTKLLASKVVFIPLKSEFQGGQLVLFESALLGKPMITTDTHAIRMYFDDQSCGLVPMGDDEAAMGAIRKVFDMKDDEIKKQCDVAYKQIKKFSADYCYSLIKKMIETDGTGKR